MIFVKALQKNLVEKLLKSNLQLDISIWDPNLTPLDLFDCAKFLPGGQAYFFSYLTIFEKYFMNNQSRYSDNSIVLYPHNEPELGSLFHQAQILNNAHAVYFFCSNDANALVNSGLIESKF